MNITIWMTIGLLAGVVLSQAEEVPSVTLNTNKYEIGTLSGRIQTLSMHRDDEGSTFSNAGSAYSTTLGLQIDYRSPDLSGLSAGASYTGAGVLDSQDYERSPDPGADLIRNGRVNVLNEGFLQFNFEALALSNTMIRAGRQVVHGEIFRADDFRQKKRALEGIQVSSKDIDGVALSGGYAGKLSNVWSAGDQWEFNDIGDNGVGWVEGTITSMDNIEIALFDALILNELNLIGGRGRLGMGDDLALLAYLRHEMDVGDGVNHESVALGISLEMILDAITLEGGYFGVREDGLAFNEINTGINHALGLSLMIYSGQFNGDTHTGYVKAKTVVGPNKTVLYGLCNMTLYEDNATRRSGMEGNIVVKQPLSDNFSVAFKSGLGFRDNKGSADTFASDVRLFATYTF